MNNCFGRVPLVLSVFVCAIVQCNQLCAALPTSGLIHSTAQLSMPRQQIGATAVGDTIFFGGGLTASGTLSDRVDRYNAVTGIWTIDQMPVALRDTVAAAVGSRAVFTD